MIFRSTASKYDRTFSSDIVNATQNPVWNTNHIFLGVDGEEWASLKLEISVWNYSNHLDHKCLGMKIYTSIDKFIEIAIFQIGKIHFIYETVFIFKGIAIFEPARMDESASNVCWYPLYSPLSTEADLLCTNEQTSSMSTSKIEQHSPARGVSNWTTTVPENTVVNTLSQQQHGVGSDISFHDVTTSKQARRWNRKFSDSGAATQVGGNFE